LISGWTRHQPAIARVVREAVTDICGRLVVVDLARREHPETCSGKGEPVARLDLALNVHGQLLEKVAANGVDLMIDG
jgi:hypothetical protein